MDHLWLDRDIQLEPDKVPYHEPDSLAYIPNGSNKWSSFVLSRLLDHLGSEQLHIILQEYFFFGLLAEYCSLYGVPFDREDFIDRRMKRPILTTSKLHLLAEQVLQARSTAFRPCNEALIHSLVYGANREDRYIPIGSPAETLAFGRDLCRQLCTELSVPRQIVYLHRLKAEEADDPLAVEVDNLLIACGKGLSMVIKRSENGSIPLVTFLTLCVLLESLSGLTNWAFARSMDGSKAQITAYDQFYPLWLSQCRKSGACPARVQALTNDFLKHSQAYIASSIIASAGNEHSTCVLDSFCRFNRKDADLPLHTQNCQGPCHMICLTAIDKSNLEAAIDSIGYGVLQWGNSDLADPEYYIDTSNVETSYVAFSHVWSHGLGNPLQNGLPACQLLALKKVTTEAGYSSHAFWLDPLCVPLDSTWKRKAIERMDLVYTRASQVIVLDRDLMRCKAPNTFKRIALFTSDWMTRIWTLQEAVFPGKKLSIAFANTILELDTLLGSLWEGDNLPTQSLIILTSEWWMLQARLCTKAVTLIQLIECFHARATTRPEDEFICLAILLGIDNRLLPAPPALPSMPDVIQHLPSIEQDIIFAPGARCDRVGFRWCPATFVSVASPMTYEGGQIKVPFGPHGICVEKEIVRLGSVDFDGLAGNDASMSVEHWLVLHFRQEREESSMVVICYDDLGATAEQLRPRHIADAALVFPKPSDRRDIPSAVLLVSITGSHEGILLARYECMVVTVPLWMYIGDGHGNELHNSHSVEISAERFRATSIWID